MMHNANCFYQEIRNNSILVKEEIGRDPESVVKPLAAVCREITRLSNIARTEGLLSLVEAVMDENIPEIILKEELKKMVMLVVDGTDPEIVTDICMKRYFANNYTGLKGLSFLVLICGALDIQAGENPQIIESDIRSCMPEEVNKELDRIHAEEEAKQKEENLDAWEKLYKRECVYQNTGYSYTVILSNFCISKMSDEDVNVLMTRADDTDLALLLKVLDGTSCKKIHDNVSEERAQIIIKDMGFMGPLRYRDVEKSTDAVFQEILKLGKAEMIHVPASLDRIFEIRDDSKCNDESKKFMKWFLGMDNRCIQRVLKEVPEETLSYAMKGWDRDLRRLIYGNLPKPVAGIISENIKYVDSMSWQIKDAYEKIEHIIQKLEDSAEIIIDDVE